MVRDYVPILVLAVLALGFAVFSVFMGTQMGPRRWNKAKLEAYECGIEPTPIPVGGELQQARRVRADRDGHLRSYRADRVRLRLAARRPGMGLAAMGIEEKLPSGVLLTT